MFMNPVVIITGASRGLGLCLAERFVKAGGVVFGTSLTRKSWESARKRISDRKKFRLFLLDITREAGVKRFISKIRRICGRIDVLINCAGYVGRLAPIEDESLREFEKNIAVNLTGPFLMCKYVLPVFRARKKGWMINISSMAGKRAVPRLGAYSAGKFGLVALTQAIAKENPGGQFKCITVCPGGMNTEMRVNLFGRKDAERQQTPEFVAEKIMEIIYGRIEMESGWDIVIRHGKVTAINPLPGA